MDKLLIHSAVLALCIAVATGLECYTCDKQDNNRGECVQTVKQCDQFQDACTSYVRWGVPAYWTPRGDRVYYISKSCDTRQGCEQRQSAVTSHCKRDWYNDWACVECCTGDLCNYYVTLGAGSTRAGMLTTLGVAVGVATLRHLW